MEETAAHGQGGEEGEGEGVDAEDAVGVWSAAAAAAVPAEPAVLVEPYGGGTGYSEMEMGGAAKGKRCCRGCNRLG